MLRNGCYLRPLARPPMLRPMQVSTEIGNPATAPNLSASNFIVTVLQTVSYHTLNDSVVVMSGVKFFRLSQRFLFFFNYRRVLL